MDPINFEVINWKMTWYWSLKDLPDGKYKITKVNNIRSLRSNRYYWGYILKYIVLEYKEYWYIYTTSYLHKIFKKTFTPRVKEKSDFSKKYVWKMWSTRALKQNQFSDYIQAIEVIMEHWEMAKLGLEKISWFVIPDIDEEELLNWMDKII